MSVFPVIVPDMTRKIVDPADRRKYIAARVPTSIVDAVQAIADADERSLSFMIEKALREFVERHNDASRPAPKPRK